MAREAVALTPTDHPDRGGRLSTLAGVLWRLFERTGELAAVTDAVILGREAVSLMPTDHPDRGICLSNLTASLWLLFERTGELAALTDAVTVGREAVAATPTNHPDRIKHLSNFVIALRYQFERTGELADLTEAVTVGREAVAACPIGDSNRAHYLSNLGVSPWFLFERTGELAALTEAVTVGREAVAATPIDHRNRAERLTDVGIALGALFNRTGELATLTEAVTVQRQAVDAIPTGDPQRAATLNNLGLALQQLFLRTGELAALTEAIAVQRQSVAITPTDHPIRARRLLALGRLLVVLFMGTGEIATLTEAVTVEREAVAAIPTDHPGHAVALDALGLALQQLFLRTGELAALTEAVSVGRQAVATTPADHPDRVGTQVSLGLALVRLYEQAGDLAVLTEAREVVAEAAASPVAQVSARIHAGRILGDVCMAAAEPQAALTALTAVVRLLPQMAPRALARQDREYGLSRLAGLSAEVAAAATAAGQPERAVELLEQSRGVLLGEAIDARSDLTELHRAAPELANQFNGIREQIAALDNAAHSLGLPAEHLPVSLDDPGWEAHRQRVTRLGERRRHLSEQWTALLERIRDTPGFDQFLQPPPISRLQRQATEGPLVVVYAGQWRSDALIVTSDLAHPVQVVPLPGLTDVTAAEQAERLMAACAADAGDGIGRTPVQSEVLEVLGWLWDAITGPVLTHLGFTGDSATEPRIWWCPIGVCVRLPLHAAGHHVGNLDCSPPPTVMDRATSSYIPTIRALEYARARRDPPRAAAGSALIIAMPTTPGATDLPGVAAEAERLSSLLGHPLTLIGSAAHYQAVIAALSQHQVAHFACHGQSNQTDPAASTLLLSDHNDRPLTVATLSRLQLTDAELAYLSACSTTQTSLALADEAVHITAAFHLAGYRRVIGTLWPIDDIAAVRIATEVYTDLTDDGTRPPSAEDSAHALAKAIRHLRDDHPILPTHWAAHLHLGA